MMIKSLVSTVLVLALLFALPFTAAAESIPYPPDILTMQDGTPVTDAAQFAARQTEIRNILEYNMYGPWRDGTGETLSYTLKSDTLAVSVTYGGKTASFNASVTLPTSAAPDGGYPVFVVFGGMGHTDYVLANGYAVITLNPTDLASDDTNRNGQFYKLYPYGDTWEEQSGVLMAWSWGASKVMDALVQGAGAELNINPQKSIITGVSRYGKAAAVAGAFDTRFAVTMPVCSGFGGMTMGRYQSNGLTFNLLPDFAKDPQAGSVADLSEWKSTGGTETIVGLQGSGWFNENYKTFAAYDNCPFDQDFLSALCAGDGRYLYMVTGIQSDMWNSPPGLWYNYEEAQPAFALLGLEDHFAIQMHLNGHSIELEDLVKLFAWLNKEWYGIDFSVSDFPAQLQDFLSGFTLDSLKTCVFADAANADVYASGKPNGKVVTVTANPDNQVPFEIKLGDVPVSTVVSRNTDGDALIEPADNGFTFTYGRTLQYGSSFARFALALPDGLNISDFESVSFTCQTDADYWGKKMAVIAAPLPAGLPSAIDYDYNTGAIPNEGVTALSTNNFFPFNTSVATDITMKIDKNTAAKLDGVSELEISLYIHMENVVGTAQYTLTNIVFNPLAGVTVPTPAPTAEPIAEPTPVPTVAPTAEPPTPAVTAAPPTPAPADENKSSHAAVVTVIVCVVILAGVATIVIRKRNKK